MIFHIFIYMEKKKYYVYVYLDPRKEGKFIYGEYKFNYEPFYVGKGLGKRCYYHLLETSKTTSNIFKTRVIQKIISEDLEPIIVKIIDNISENEAYKIETELIKIIGRRCDGSGTLTNIVTDAKPPSNYVKLSDDVVKKIIELYNEGWYLKHIGDKLGLAEMKIKKSLIENGITPKRKPPTNKINLSETIILQIIERYQNGASIRKICDEFLLSFEKVRRILKENNVKLRGYDYPKTKEHIEKIWANREHLMGEDSPSYKTLSLEEIQMLKHLKFVEKKPIKEIIKIMKISQKKYYEYINY